MKYIVRRILLYRIDADGDTKTSAYEEYEPRVYSDTCLYIAVRFVAKETKHYSECCQLQYKLMVGKLFLT